MAVFSDSEMVPGASWIPRRLLLRGALPLLLIAWAMGADRNVALPVYGDPLAGGGFVAGGLILLAISWWQRGGQDSPREIRYWVRHPEYTGLVGLCLGVSMIARSPGGLWLVTPVVALSCAALAFGSLPWLPPDDETRPSTAEGCRFVFVVVIPWLLMFGFTSHMGLAGTAFRFSFEDHLPVFPWTAFVYETSYLTVTFAAIWTASNRQLRQLMLTAWVAILVVFPIYWLMPSAAPRRPMVDNSWIAHLLMEERKVPPGSAFPSFHVLWAIFVGRLWPKWLWIAYSVVIGISCITTGMHYIPDVLAAFALAPLLLEPGRLLWQPLLRVSGQVRKASAVVWSALVPVALMIAAVGPGRWFPVLVASAAGLLARSWYAGLIGVALVCALFGDRWLLWGVCCLGAPWILQFAGDRVGLPAVLGNAFLGLLLLRLWNSGNPLSMICGVFLIGSGLLRFAEGASWRAGGCVLAGAVVTTITSPAAGGWHFTLHGLGIAVVAGVAFAFGERFLSRHNRTRNHNRI